MAPEQATAIDIDNLPIANAASEVVAIRVGDEKTYYLHKALLTGVSRYFRAAFEKNFREAAEKTINLPHVDTRTFDIFSEWLYTSELHLPVIKPNNLSGNPMEYDGNRHKEHLLRTRGMLSLYILGDEHEIAALRRVVIDAMFSDLMDPDSLLPSNNDLITAYSRLPRSSPMLQLIVHAYCLWYTSDALDDVAEPPIEFIRDCFKRYVTMSSKIRTGAIEACYTLDRCDYHEHATPEERRCIIMNGFREGVKHQYQIRADKSGEDEDRRPTFTVIEAGPLATIAVAGGSVFHVNKALLTKVSRYFAAALDGGFKGTQTQSIKLQHVDETTFQIFVDWLHTGRLNMASAVSARPDAYTKLPVSSPLIKLFVNWHIKRACDSAYPRMKVYDSMPLGLFSRHQSMKERFSWHPFKLYTCDYHEHASEQERKECKQNPKRIADQKRILAKK
ncbi:hypothetical protein BDV96DRAFT_597546 [Lophiotrema nucula]|uniref:BTB domain-containing protein n=1 Tax=Lophiotrema nucula TaxID=690887 RepID=A0A6A5ZEL4_9PLEO|nr:hypothetical protein BDV96DRAFT_597546 [Lophiotrema nucula]